MNLVLQSWPWVVMFFASWINRQQQDVIEYLRAENAIMQGLGLGAGLEAARSLSLESCVFNRSKSWRHKNAVFVSGSWVTVVYVNGPGSNECQIPPQLPNASTTQPLHPANFRVAVNAVF